MTAIESIVAAGHEHLSSVINRSGEILYSGAHTIRRGPIYLLGLNPGGDPNAHRKTILYHLENLPSKVENHYLDQSWGGALAGTRPLQRRVQWLARSLGQDLRNVCASNLIFVRSVDARSCGYPRLAQVCWPVHHAILAAVEPRLVIAFGNSGVSPYGFLRSVFRLSSAEESFPSGHGDWRCLAFRSAGMRIAGLPHLSRYAVDRHPAVAEWLGGLLAV
jgi:hypothetical protein